MNYSKSVSLPASTCCRNTNIIIFFLWQKKENIPSSRSMCVTRAYDESEKPHTILLCGQTTAQFTVSSLSCIFCYWGPCPLNFAAFMTAHKHIDFSNYNEIRLCVLTQHQKCEARVHTLLLSLLLVTVKSVQQLNLFTLRHSKQH